MATVKAANVTKYDAGADPSNYGITEGLIKSVEKVWIDSYVVAATLLSTSSLLLGYVPAGRNLVEVIVSLPAMNTVVATLGSVYLGTGATTAAGVLGKMMSDFEITDSFSMTTAQTLRLTPKGQAAGHMKAATETGIYMTVWLIGEATALTGGTIRSLIRYT